MNPVRYVEYDENGDLTHVAEVLVNEGVDVPPRIPEPLKESQDPALRKAEREERRALRLERETRVADIIAERQAALCAALTARASGADVRMLVLPDGADMPALDTHRVDDGRRLARRATTV